MAIEVMSTTTTVCLEAAAAGLQSVEHLMNILSQQHYDNLKQDNEYKAVADVAVNNFKKVISLLDRSRTGHARFRRGPQQKPEPKIVLDTINSNKVMPSNGSAFRRVQRLPPLPYNKPKELLSGKTINFSSSPAISSATSSLTCDTSFGKPPLSGGSLKRKCSSIDESKCGVSSSRCHCSKRRKTRTKRVVRVAAVSTKTAEIPADDYSWRKYGQKPIKGSPHPRGYYKCSSVRGCPAKKHVERALDEESMLIVTYEGDHNHPLHFTDANLAVSLILESS